MFGKGFRLYSASLKCKTVPFKMFLTLSFAYLRGKKAVKNVQSGCLRWRKTQIKSFVLKHGSKTKIEMFDF